MCYNSLNVFFCRLEKTPSQRNHHFPPILLFQNSRHSLFHLIPGDEPGDTKKWDGYILLCFSLDFSSGPAIMVMALFGRLERAPSKFPIITPLLLTSAGT